MSATCKVFFFFLVLLFSFSSYAATKFGEYTHMKITSVETGWGGEGVYFKAVGSDNKVPNYTAPNGATCSYQFYFPRTDGSSNQKPLFKENVSLLMAAFAAGKGVQVVGTGCSGVNIIATSIKAFE